MYHSSRRGGPSRGKTTQARTPSKQIQTKQSKIAWISLDSFVRIGTYQWVTRKKVKKSAPVFIRAVGCAQRPRSPRPIEPTRSDPADCKHTTRFRFKEAFAQISNSPHRPAFFMCRKWGVPPSPRLTLLYRGFFGEPEMAGLRATLRDIAKNRDIANAFD